MTSEAKVLGYAAHFLIEILRCVSHYVVVAIDCRQAVGGAAHLNFDMSRIRSELR